MVSRDDAARRRRAERAERSGSGPAREGWQPPAWPGASQGFALFGEVMLMGILVTLLALPVVTFPAALAASIRHMRRFLAARESGLASFWRDVWAGLGGSALLALGASVIVVVLLIDIDLARSGFLPGGLLIEAVGWAGFAALAIGMLSAARAWTPEIGWRGALRAVPADLRGDPVGAAYLLVIAAFAATVTWQLLPLIIPALGCVVFATVAAPERPRRR